MTIQYASDLHLELKENADFVESGALETAGEVILLAGDTCRLDRWDSKWDSFFDWLSEHYRQVLMVPGEHEFGRPEDMALLGNSWRYMLRENVGVYYNQVVRMEGVEIVMVGNGEFLQQYPHQTGMQTIAVSHHRPQKEWLTAPHITHWIYGQTHESQDKRWCKTPKRRGNHCPVRLLSNQLGYVLYDQHLMGYSINKNITL